MANVEEAEPMMDLTRWGCTENEFRRQNVNGFFGRLFVNGCCGSLLMNRENGWCKAWKVFILACAIYSLLVTPFQFGYFRVLPHILFLIDILVESAFFIDVLLQVWVSYRDRHSCGMVYSRNLISHRYLKFFFIPDLLSCMPWETIYKVVGRKGGVRFLLFIRVIRSRKVLNFFHGLEEDIRISFLFTRILEVIVVQLYLTHAASCIFYYLATTVPPKEEGNTWIGSLKLGNFSYEGFREIAIGKRYTTSLYFAFASMTTVGYGDVHPVNTREMIVFIFYISVVAIVDAYLMGNMAALMVKGSRMERYRDKLAALVKIMNRNGIKKSRQNQIKEHMRLHYESSYGDTLDLQDIPNSIRAKLSQTLYESHVKNILLFKNCSSQFINQIVTRVHPEYFLPGEVIINQGDNVDQLYFVFHGILEEVLIGADGLEEPVSLLEPKSFFGEIPVLCNIPQPFTVRVLDVCRVLRIDKQSFSKILEIYSHDRRNVLTNLMEVKESNVLVKQLESVITFHIEKQEMEMALRVNSAAYYGHLDQLKSLILSGVDPNKKDYYERSPLHLAASRGYEDITIFLIQRGADVNAEDRFGNTPLAEAVKGGHHTVASLLSQRGASLKIDNPGSYLCALVERQDSDLLRRVLGYMDSNSENYDKQLHEAAYNGLYTITRVLTTVPSVDRMYATLISEARNSGHTEMVQLLDRVFNTNP